MTGDSSEDFFENLRDTYGTWDRYQEEVAKLPVNIQKGLKASPNEGGFAVPDNVVEFFKRTSALTGKKRYHEVCEGNDASDAARNLSCGRCTVHNLLSEPSLLLPDASVVYIGRESKKQQLSASPLANLSRMRGDSHAERDRVCTEDLQRLIAVLKVQKGKTWDEIKRLALLVRGGEDIKLICYCAPLRCHGDAIAFVINALAAKTKVPEIIENLRALLPAAQKNLLGE